MQLREANLSALPLILGPRTQQGQRNKAPVELGEFEVREIHCDIPGSPRPLDCGVLINF